MDAAAPQLNPMQQFQGAIAGFQTGMHKLAGNAFKPQQQQQARWKLLARPGAGAAAAAGNKRRVTFAHAAPFAAIIPGDSVAEQVLTTGVNNFLSLYNSALVVRLVLTWFPSVPAAIEAPLATVCDPYLGLFRGIIPPLGGTLDFSPILAFVVLSVFTNTAAALPCELGPDGRTPVGHQKHQQEQQQQGSMFDWLPLSKYQQAWAKRVHGSRQAGDGGEPQP